MYTIFLTGLLNQCYICGSKFGNIICAYCNQNTCSSCLIESERKCRRCAISKKPRSGFLRRNIPFILMMVAIWFFVSGLYPFPYFYAVGMPVDEAIMQPVLIATAIFMIPFIFIMIAWRKRPPY